MARERRSIRNSQTTSPTSQEATNTKPAVEPKAKAPAKPKVAKAASAVAPKAKSSKKATTKAKAEKPADRRKNRTRATSRKHDPIKMFEWYCEDVTRTYADIAKQFNVSPSVVSNMAAKEDTTWLERRMKVIEKLENKITKRRYKEAKERDESHLKAFRAAITANTNTIITEGNKKGADKDVKAITASSNALYKAVMGERIILGLPVLIARSEILAEDDEQITLRDVHLDAARMAERAQELEDMRNNG